MQKQLSLVTQLLALLVCALVFSLTSTVTFAQSITPLQLDQIKRLSPNQRNAVLKELAKRNSTPAASSEVQAISTEAPKDSTESEARSAADRVFRLKPNDSLIIEFTEIEEDSELLEDVRDALGKNFYELDDRGYLFLSGLGSIQLAGLSAKEAKLRLEAEPSLRALLIDVYLLPLQSVGSSALDPFGYELFKQSSAFENSSTNIPVPVGYIVGPGDVLSLFVYGQQSAEYRLKVGRDGQITIPEIGPVAVSGMNYEQLREEINNRMEQRYIGVSISLTLSELRSIQVFVLGDVKQPGSYTLSSLSTMTNALMQSGGIARSGSLRNVQLKRNDRLVGTLDLYELLLKGNNKGDQRLKSGDVVYVPPVGGQISVFGQVNRPSIYELKKEATLDAVLALAGGLLPSAFKQNVQIERYSTEGTKTVVVADLTQKTGFPIRSGDQVNIQNTLDEIRDVVQVKGHVKRESVAQWRPGLRLLNLLPDSTIFRLQADQEYLLIRRVDEKTGRIALVAANWRAAYHERSSGENIELNRGDTVHVFALTADRALKIAPLIAEIETQGSYINPTETVSVQGRVRASGKYPYAPNMRISDLILAAGSTMDNAYLDQVEITRIERNGGSRSTIHLSTSLYGLIVGSDQDLLLTPDDVLTVKEIPLWRERQSVTMSGEVLFPGNYSASRGERISEVVKRAGGLTSMAFVNGSVFVRKDLKQRESEQLKKLADRVRGEMLAFNNSQSDARINAEELLNQLEKTKPIGRLVIDLDRALAGDPEHDVILEDGDKLVVPSISQEVTVIGEVQYPTSHIYQKNQNQFLYIEKSGGLTSNADRRRIYVIRADGQVIAFSPNRWFSSASGVIQTQPGDTIVVPFDADRIGKLELWSTVSQIVYNIGVAAAAVAAF